MQEIVAKAGLALMSHYPDDLLVFDRAILEKHALPGSKIGWCVGDLHTHMTVLGVHPGENECVGYHTNLGSKDRFYLLTVGQEQFAIVEQSRDAYAALSRTAVPYEKQGNPSCFWVKRAQRDIGCIALESTGTYEAPVETATIAPVEGISRQERAALELWCQYGIMEKARTLFARAIVNWAEPLKDLHAA